MTYKIPSKSDRGGTTYFVDELKVNTQVNWNNVIKDLDSSSQVIIVTYSITNFDFIKILINKGKHLTIVLNSLAPNYKYAFRTLINISNKIKIISKNDVHAKMILGSGNFVYIGSDNIDKSTWFQNIITFKDPQIYNYFYKQLIHYLNDNSTGNILVRAGELDKTVAHSSSYQKSNNIYNSKGSMVVQNVRIKLGQMKNWNQKFNNLSYRNIIITTYSLPKINYIETILTKLFYKENCVTIIANDVVRNKLRLLKKGFPDLITYTKPDIHAKMVLIDSNIVWLSSQNFGTSGWFETLMNIKTSRKMDNIVFDYFKGELDNYMGFYL